ncbi:unnamed protein product [Cylicostephanus goldi]|uniref:Uncharacterized protein n=1 Tax=Cylicostephanus goldi TaxID=71465 RepID=A0A3P7N0K7_CYLGO|nr:unnamed protein product [Cylicostephanus goldi]
MPWKCYRCSYQATRADSYEHLRHCFPDEQPSQDDAAHVIGVLGDVNLRSGRSVQKEGAGELMTINGETKPLSEFSAREALEAMVGPEKAILTTKKRRSRYGSKASISAGIIPSGTNRISITGDGKMRFRFRKAGVKDCAAGISEYPRYLDAVHKAHDQWQQETIALPLCSRLRDIVPSTWETASTSAHLPFISKESVGFRIRESEDKGTHQDVPHSCQRLSALCSIELKREIQDYVTVAYCGGPICAISIAPNAMPNGETASFC